MEIEKIISSGFFKQFISDYYEDKIYTYYPDKDRLLYILCDTEIEKEKVTLVQIKKIKKKIKSLGNEEFSFSFILSGRSESHEFINDYNERQEFWLDRFHQNYIDDLITLQPIYENFELFQKTRLYKEYGAEKFWDIYPEAEKPEETCISDILLSESDLIFDIEYAIDAYKKEKHWEIDFDTFRKYTKTSKPIKDLFDISELFVQLNRLEMFKGFIEPSSAADEKKKSKNDKLKVELEKYGFFNLEMVKSLSDLNKKKLVDSIRTSNLPYKIAYLDYLGFNNQLEKNYSKTRNEFHKLFSNILCTNERAVRGNINGLKNEKSLDRSRYTAYLHSEKIIEHYETLI